MMASQFFRTLEGTNFSQMYGPIPIHSRETLPGEECSSNYYLSFTSIPSAHVKIVSLYLLSHPLGSASESSSVFCNDSGFECLILTML